MSQPSADASSSTPPDSDPKPSSSTAKTEKEQQAPTNSPVVTSHSSHHKQIASSTPISLPDTANTGYSQLLLMDHDERTGSSTKENGPDSVPLTSTNAFSGTLSGTSSPHITSPTTLHHRPGNSLSNTPRTSTESAASATQSTTSHVLLSPKAIVSTPVLSHPDADDHHSILSGEISPNTARPANSVQFRSGDGYAQSIISTTSSDIENLPNAQYFQDVHPLLTSPLASPPHSNDPGAPSIIPTHTVDDLEIRNSIHGGVRNAAGTPDGGPASSRPARLNRSLSVVSIRALNDTVDWIVDQFHRYKRGRRGRMLVRAPRPNEIYYSVFKPPKTMGQTFSLTIDDLQTGKDGYAQPLQATQAEFDAIIDDAIESIESLHINPKLISQGSSGSYFVYNTSGTIVGVFKPKDEEPYGPLSPKWTKWLHRNLFPCFFGRSCLIPNNGYIAEAAASLLDRQLGTHIVPFTDIVHMSAPTFYYRFFDRRNYRLKGKPLPPKIGSLQLFLHDYVQADQFLRDHPLDNTRRLTRTTSFASGFRPPRPESGPHFEWTPQIIAQFREEIEKLVILDYIMRNTDRGLDNWMVKLEWYEDISSDSPEEDNSDDSTVTGSDEDNKKKKKKLIPFIRLGAIDSGLAFPWKHPDEWRSYPFGWLFLPMILIGQPFSQRTRDHFLPLLTSSEWWEESAVVFRHLFSQDTEFSERMFKRQWAVLKGQAFNVVETLKDPEQGPLELVRRTRVMVWDDEMDVPVNVPYDTLSTAIETPLWASHSNFAHPTTSAAAYPPMGPPSTDIWKKRPGTVAGIVNRPYADDPDEIDVATVARRAAQATEEALQNTRNVAPISGSSESAQNGGTTAGDTGHDSTKPLKKGKRMRGSSLILEARYRELEHNSSDHDAGSSSHHSKRSNGATGAVSAKSGSSGVISGSGGSGSTHGAANGDAAGSGAASAAGIAGSGHGHGHIYHHQKPLFEDLIEAPGQKKSTGSNSGNTRSHSDSQTDTGSQQRLEPYRDDPSAAADEDNEGLHNVGFSIAEDFSQASRKVVVERLQTVTSRPPVFTWC
ncbi:uncharacterized protein SAPINGB_P001264 [Magnusiomyces paraingens]|uniref:1-phosphatidylinositol 4-kinase n=1 Tax=Magnusiomyces paraingens TaxID=2606893 RepID=A0A5E8B4U1_9ASCO|nr:uncharacterized protein SAPINGB_P001264 [Saprochaete ingens]VVT46540.1 unnamed protein product [Saprochaete ingens]